MILVEYIVRYWGLLVLLGGLMLHLSTNVYLEKSMVKRYHIIIGLLFTYSLTEYAELLLGEMAQLHFMRSVLTAFNYTLISAILAETVRLLFARSTKLLYVPLIVNGVLCTVSIFTPIVFYFTEDNHFQRGILGYLPYFVAAVYLLYLFIRLTRSYGNQVKEDFLVILFMVVTAIACFIIPLLWSDRFFQWFGTTIAANLFIYYVFILHQYTKRDALTGLLNRQSYYADIEKRGKNITALIALDMNGLKELNDHHGHIAGDKALSGIGKAMLAHANTDHRMYRIGGDEFAVLCYHTTEPEVKKLIARLTDSINKSGATCSIGYSYTAQPRSIDDLYKEADAMLYVEKERYYEETGKQRRLI